MEGRKDGPHDGWARGRMDGWGFFPNGSSCGLRGGYPASFMEIVTKKGASGGPGFQFWSRLDEALSEMQRLSQTSSTFPLS